MFCSTDRLFASQLDRFIIVPMNASSGFASRKDLLVFICAGGNQTCLAAPAKISLW